MIHSHPSHPQPIWIHGDARFSDSDMHNDAGDGEGNIGLEQRVIDLLASGDNATIEERNKVSDLDLTTLEPVYRRAIVEKYYRMLKNQDW